MVSSHPQQKKITQGTGESMRQIIIAVMLLLLISLPAMAATNSYTIEKTTTSELSTGAWYSGCTISSDRIFFNSGNGYYVSSAFNTPNQTYSSANTFTPSKDDMDYGWYGNSLTWINSTDYRELTAGFIGYSIRYPFYDISCSDAWFYSSGDIQTPTVSGNPTILVTDVYKPWQNRIHFDGSGDYLTTAFNYNCKEAHTIAVMVYDEDKPGYGSVIRMQNATSSAYIDFQMVDPGGSEWWQINIRDSAGNTAAYGNSSKRHTYGETQYIVIRTDGSNIYLYSNGVLQTSGSLSFAGNLKMTSIMLGSGLGGDWKGYMDEFRFYRGDVGSSYASTSSTLYTFMNNCWSGTGNLQDLNYAMKNSFISSYSGNTYFSVYSWRGSTGDPSIGDISNTFLNTIPIYGTSYPDGIDYPSSDVTLRVGSAHDADISYTSNITAAFYVDGVSKGTSTITSNGNIDKNIGSQTGGLHEWYAIVYDPWGGSITTDTYEFGVTSTLYIKDEETNELINSSEVTVSFYTDNTSVVRTSSNGSISLYGLPTSDMLVSASADGYISRKTIVFSLYDTNSIYLLNDSADVIYQKFVLNTQTISGSPTDYILKIQKPMNGTVNTVFSSYFDFDGVCGTYLIESDVYQLVIVAPDGTESTYGYLYPDPDGQIDIAYEGISFNEYVNAWLVTNTTINKDTKSISLAYTEAEQTNSLNPISVTEATMIVTDEAGNQVYNVTVTDSSYVFQYIAASEGLYNVNLAITGEDEDGQEFSYTKSFAADFIDDHFQFMPDAYPDWLKMLVIVFLCILLLVSFGGYRSDLACGLSFGLLAFSAYQDWISVSALALGVLFIIVMAAFFRLQRKEGRRA